MCASFIARLTCSANVRRVSAVSPPGTTPGPPSGSQPDHPEPRKFTGTYSDALLRGVELVGMGRIIDDEGKILEIGKTVAVKYNGPNAVSEAALPFIEAQARKRLGVAFQIERTVSWDHTKLGGAY